MALLKYLGTKSEWDIQPGHANDVATLSLVNLLLSQNMTLDQATTEINADLAPYATKASADTAMTPLATPAYVNTQAANYVPTTTVGHANGPVPLRANGLVIPGLINAASTQEWPSPFWSPASYNAASVVATTTPVQIYPLAIPDPGYVYRLLCFGSVDTSVAVDDGTLAEVEVRVGSTTGQIIAIGYGCAESYGGPAPGTLTSQSFLNQTFTITGAWLTITGLLPVNNASYTTVMVGNYVQAPTTTTATLAASFTYSGATASGSKSSVSTQIRIVDNAGTVIVTGTASTLGSDTVTATFTGSVVAGTLYGVQIAESGAGTFGSCTAGTFTISAPTTINVGSASVIPSPLDLQTSITGATTLYVMLRSSNDSTQVSASNAYPALWACPIPWA